MIIRDLISLDGEWPDLGPISGDKLAGLRHHEVFESPDLWRLPAINGETPMNDTTRAHLAPLQPREDRVTFFDLVRLVFAPKKGKHS